MLAANFEQTYFIATEISKYVFQITEKTVF
jgi:hypothetical protein